MCQALSMAISGTEMPTHAVGPKEEEEGRMVQMQEVGGNQVAMGLVIQDEAWHIVGTQLINHGSIKENLRSTRLSPK